MEERLRCEECASAADERARGWRALHGAEFDHDELETFVFCPECAEKQFGPQWHASMRGRPREANGG